MEEPVDEVPSIRSNLSQIILWSLLLLLCTFTLVLSQLDNLTTGEVYAAISRLLYIDLNSLGVSTEQISDAGHSVAGFVLYGVARFTIGRRWVLPLLLIFFAGLEAAQLFSVERQASWMDLLRGWSGVAIAWAMVTISEYPKMGWAKNRKS